MNWIRTCVSVVVARVIMVRVVVRLVVVLRATIDVTDVLGAVVDVVPSDMPDVHLLHAEVVSALEERGRHTDSNLDEQVSAGEGRRDGRCVALADGREGGRCAEGRKRGTRWSFKRKGQRCDWQCWLWALINASCSPHASRSGKLHVKTTPLSSIGKHRGRIMGSGCDTESCCES